MKSIFLIPILFFCLSLQLLAQSPNAARASRATQNMNKVLELSDEQKRAVSKAYLNMYEGLEQIQEVSDKKETDQQTNEIRIKFNNTLTKALDKGQMDKWVKINSKEDNPNIRVKKDPKISTEQRTEMAAKTRAQRLTKQLSLSPQQEQQAYKVYSSKMSKIVALRPLAKKDPTTAKTERMKLNRELDAAIAGILTEDQKVKMENDKKRIQVGKSKSNKGSKKSKTYSMADKNTNEAEAFTKRTEAKIEMTEDQRRKFQAAATEKYRALDYLKANSKGKTAEEKAGAKIRIDAAFETEIKTILTKGQLERLTFTKAEY
ncbi:MAG: hypothetical protein ACI8YQ_002994 [Polaribacter sp.]|jgi:hypothetical protein